MRERVLFTSIKTVPKCLKYQFNKEYVSTHNYSDKCCREFKKHIFWEYEQESGRLNAFTGMRSDEGGNRENLNCITQAHNGKHFNVLIPVSDEFEEEFIKRNNIRLCELYYPPFNFKRTGCMGCPYNKHLQQELDVLEKYAPNTYKQCNLLWQPTYDEYRRIGYRLRKKGTYRQMNIFDYIEE